MSWVRDGLIDETTILWPEPKARDVSTFVKKPSCTRGVRYFMHRGTENYDRTCDLEVREVMRCIK